MSGKYEINIELNCTLFYLALLKKGIEQIERGQNAAKLFTKALS